MNSTDTPPNQLYFSDNLDILRQHVADESVDLIYLDPPFNSNATYNVLFRERTGDESAAQITAFDDTSHWAIGLRPRCLQKEGHSGVYQTRHRRYHLVSQRQTFQRESLLTCPLRCPNYGVHYNLPV